MIVCLLGPSGAGRSTLAKRLHELCPESFARISVDFFIVPRPAGVPTRRVIGSIRPAVG